jgi:hypothetical protein
MEFLGITIVEHPSVPVEDAWLINKRNAPQVPPDLRSSLPVPCILTGDAAGAAQLLSFVRAIDGQYVNSGASRLKNRRQQ